MKRFIRKVKLLKRDEFLDNLVENYIRKDLDFQDLGNPRLTPKQLKEAFERCGFKEVSTDLGDWCGRLSIEMHSPKGIKIYICSDAYNF